MGNQRFRQCVTQSSYTDFGDLRIAEIHTPQFGQVFEVDQSGIGDLCAQGLRTSLG